jgi:hypothetical protein
MARVSFTLRKDGLTLPGSYLQYNSSLGARTDDDNALRSDGFQIPPLLTNVVVGGNQYAAAAYFSVDAVDYGVTYITWGVPLTAASAVGGTPVATEVVIVYSPDGEPDTIDGGAALVETTTSSEYYHNPPSGKWAYYTLFLKYQGSSGDLYYEPAAKLSVLVPTNYGSTDVLYNHIPQMYREYDVATDTGTGGHLYRYLSIFGWDADRLRTLIEYFIGCRDPRVARTEELDHIADEIGVPLSSVELGTSRLRAFMDEIGIIRRASGIETNLANALTALTGSEVIVDAATRNIYIKPNRVNLFRDPLLTNPAQSSLDGGFPTTTVFSTTVDGGLYNTRPVPASVNPTTDGGSPSSVYAFTTGYWWFYPDPTQANTTIFETTGTYLAIGAGRIFYFSVDVTGQDVIKKLKLYYKAGGVEVEAASATTATVVGGRKYWKLVIPDTYTGDPNVYLRAEYTTTPAEPTALFKNILLEENNIGPFFYGGTTRGGWVHGDIGGSTGSVSDYRWYDPVIPPASPLANNSFSVYSSNYQKTKSVVDRLLPTLLPVTELVTSGTVYSNQPFLVTKWTVTYNYVPGYGS